MNVGVAALPPVSQLYRRHRTRALAIARRILGDAEEAEDVVQEVFVRLCRGLGRFDGKAAYSTWLYRVMVNSSINTLRARRRRERLSQVGSPPVTPEEQAIGSEMSSQLESALREVSERHRQVLWLREVRGLSYPEIAGLLRIPEGTVKSALNRGRSQLQDILRERGHEP